MDLVVFLTLITVVLIATGVILTAGIIWTILSGRDRLYRQKYNAFLDQQQRVRDRIREQHDRRST